MVGTKISVCRRRRPAVVRRPEVSMPVAPIRSSRNPPPRRTEEKWKGGQSWV